MHHTGRKRHTADGPADRDRNTVCYRDDSRRDRNPCRHGDDGGDRHNGSDHNHRDTVRHGDDGRSKRHNSGDHCSSGQPDRDR